MQGLVRYVKLRRNKMVAPILHTHIHTPRVFFPLFPSNASRYPVYIFLPLLEPPYIKLTRRKRDRILQTVPVTLQADDVPAAALNLCDAVRIYLRLRLRYLEGVCLGVENPVVEADEVRGREDEVEVLERLGEPEALCRVSTSAL